jgi:ADP-ribose pyrophosphatase YjhB (NUDIX family)
VQANGVFVHLPSRVEQGLRARGWLFYNFIGAGGARFMCGWDTAPETVDRLLDDIRELSAFRNEPLALLPRCAARLARPARRVVCRGCRAVPAAASCIGTTRRRCWRRWSSIRAGIVLARNHAWAAGAFGLITGFLERGEDPAAGVAREVKEELGLDATAVTLIGVYPFARKHEVIIAYHVVGRRRDPSQRGTRRVPADRPGKLKAWDFGTGALAVSFDWWWL